VFVAEEKLLPAILFYAGLGRFASRLWGNRSAAGMDPIITLDVVLGAISL